jgi:hypothetical protein
MATTAQPEAGSFLIARGRRQGYRLLLVPDFVTTDEHRHLVDNVQSTSEQEAPRIAYAEGSLALVYRARTLRAEDLDNGRPVRDEHGRPLTLLYGFATRARRVDRVDEADLDRAWHDAISVYRAFLSHESAFQPVGSARFALASLVTTPPGYPPSSGYAEPVPPPPRVLRWLPVAAGVVAVLGIVLGVLRPWQSPSEPVTARVQTPTTLASEPRRDCAPPDCQSRGDVAGQRLRAVCQIHGDPMPDDQTGSSDLWYGIDRDGAIAYLPEVWVQPRDQGGLGLPSCVATTR